MSCYVTGNTYNPVLTVQEVSTSVARSRCLKAWELLLGTLAGVHLDSGDRTIASSHYDPILEVDGTSRSENEHYNSINIFIDYIHSYYFVLYGKLNPGVVLLEVVESSSVLVPVESQPPMRRVPAGLCQDTWAPRPSDREWDCSHSPSKVRQLVPVSPSLPPHAVKDDCVCAARPGDRSLGSRQLRPLDSHTSAVCWASSSSFSPPVINSPEANYYFEWILRH